jgi:hypothetical protein
VLGRIVDELFKAARRRRPAGVIEKLFLGVGSELAALAIDEREFGGCVS